MNECLRLTDKNFENEIKDSELPVFIDFWGSWCPPCKMIEPIMDVLADEFDGVVKVAKLNIDQNPQARSKFNVMAAPTFIMFEDGKIVQRAIGSRSKKQLIQMIEGGLVSEKPKRSLVSLPSKETASGKLPSAVKEN